MPALLEQLIDRRATHIASNVGKVLGFSIGYKLASRETDAFHIKLLNAIGCGVLGSVVGRVMDRYLFQNTTTS
jgi:hypothetical protein